MPSLVDEFTAVYHSYIAGQMPPIEKITQLLLHADRGQILDRLRERYPGQISALEGELAYEEEK